MVRISRRRFQKILHYNLRWNYWILRRKKSRNGIMIQQVDMRRQGNLRMKGIIYLSRVSMRRQESNMSRV